MFVQSGLEYNSSHTPKQALVAHSDVCSTGDQDVADLIPARSGNILSWRLIMKYFL